MKLISVVLLGCCLSLINGQFFNRRLTSFFCGRRPGVVYKNGRCQDKDECKEKPSPCDEHEICINTEGSFKCVQVTPPPPPPDPCQPNPCRRNYNCVPRGSRHSCQDVNECRRRPSPCPRNSQCRNTPGSFNCQCNTGYSGPRCTVTPPPPPSDPCQPNPCRRNYNCVPRGSRHSCQDVNECRRRPSPCPSNSRCRNTPGSFNCQCNTGYSGSRCTDINECRSNPCRRNQKCVNTPGSYRCENTRPCKTGYTGTPCRDINECVVRRDICRGQRCVNTDGSYRCVPRTPCRPGYSGSPCRDIDECASNPCRSNENCVNTPGSYNCVPTSEDTTMCKGRPRKWGKCSTTRPERRSTTDTCDTITEDCSPGRAIAQQFMDNVLMPAQAVPAAAIQTSSLGARLGSTKLSLRNVPRNATASCTLMTVRDDQGNIVKAKCEAKAKANVLQRRKRQVATPIIRQTKRDLLIMLDESGSIDIDNFEKVKDIAAAIVELLCEQISVNPRKTRVSITTFDRRVTLPIPLLEGHNRDRNAVLLAHYIRNNIHFNDGTASRTCLISALEHAYDTALSSSNGGRRGQPDVEQDIILISDGCENCVPRNRVSDYINHITSFFIQEGIHVYVIGITVNRACQETLALLAQGGRCFHFFYLDRWDYEVDDFLYELKNPPDDLCINVFESPFGECLDPISRKK